MKGNDLPGRFFCLCSNTSIC